jgi:hypothetical protein
VVAMGGLEFVLAGGGVVGKKSIIRWMVSPRR